MVKLLEFLDRHTARHLFRSSHLKPNNNTRKIKESNCFFFLFFYFFFFIANTHSNTIQ